jgi:hypothetical protein
MSFYAQKNTYSDIAKGRELIDVHRIELQTIMILNNSNHPLHCTSSVPYGHTLKFSVQ